MSRRKETAERVLGHVEWISEEEGYCVCPGERKHTCPTGMRDSRVVLNGVPTVYCFHRSCGAELEAANKVLRRELWNDRWRLVLPDGREVTGMRSNRGAITGVPGRGQSGEMAAREVGWWRERLGRILEEYAWPVSAMEADSPRAIRRSDGYGQFGLWLGHWQEDDVIWIGDVQDSGHRQHARHFRPVRDWRRIGPVLGNYTCGSCFRAGAYTRSKAESVARRFLVVESDELKKDEVGAVFRYLARVLGYPLRAVVDTGGKSLHGWFGAPRTAEKEEALKRCLTGLRCDPRMFSMTQPARVPGAYRDGKLQRLLYSV